MRRIIISAGIIFITIFAIGFYLFSQSEEFIFLEAKFQNCPYGHNSLKAVSISYGFPSLEEIESGEIYDESTVMGGCLIGEDSPNYTVVCNECGFQKHTHGDEIYWERHSGEVESFEIELRSIIKDFPVVGPKKLNDRNERSSISYIQQISQDEIQREVVSYNSENTYSSFRQIFLEFAASNDLLLIEKEYPYDEPNYLAFKATGNGIYYEFDAFEYETNISTGVKFEWRNFDYNEQ